MLQILPGSVFETDGIIVVSRHHQRRVDGSRPAITRSLKNASATARLRWASVPHMLEVDMLFIFQADRRGLRSRRGLYNPSNPSQCILQILATPKPSPVSYAYISGCAVSAVFRRRGLSLQLATLWVRHHWPRWEVLDHHERTGGYFKLCKLALRSSLSIFVLCVKLVSRRYTSSTLGRTRSKCT